MSGSTTAADAASRPATTANSAASPRRVFTVLENNPEVMNELAKNLGLSPDLAFHDIYSLDDPELLALVPRPVYAVLAIVPMTDAWNRDRAEENENMEWYGDRSGQPDEPVLWFRQTIVHGCGLIGFLHCVFNGVAENDAILPGSVLASIHSQAKPLNMDDRAALLHKLDDMHRISEAAAQLGDTKAVDLSEAEKMGQHFVAFVKGHEDGHLWELEGSRKGPLDRGVLGADEDALSEKALRLGLKRLVELEKASGGGDLRFSCIALAPREKTD